VVVYIGVLSADVPPPTIPPTSAVECIQVGGLRFNASAYYWQDFMPSVPPEGPPFAVVIWVTVTNNGTSTAYDLTAIKATVYFAGTLNPLGTFRLTRIGTGANSTSPGDTIVMEFTNERGVVFSPDLEEGTGLYARVLVTWADSQQVILTTPPSPVHFTY